VSAPPVVSGYVAAMAKHMSWQYGQRVCEVGEDGAVLLLGHVDRRRAIAAANRYARTVWGLANLVDDPQCPADLIEVTQHWAVPAHQPGCVTAEQAYRDGQETGPDEGCGCWTAPQEGGGWSLTWVADPMAAHVFPVTVVES
jgi:hypothetical protein